MPGLRRDVAVLEEARLLDGDGGLRGDVRYFRSFENNSTFDNGINIDLKNFDFWRGSIGVVIR